LPVLADILILSVAAVVAVLVAVARSAPQCLTDLIGGVPGELRSGVGVALGLAELGVAEDLLHNADVDALLEQQRPGCMPGVVYTRLADSGGGQQRAPVFPVIMRVDRRARRRAEPPDPSRSKSWVPQLM
jgi:hypothetical protein